MNPPQIYTEHAVPLTSVLHELTETELLYGICNLCVCYKSFSCFSLLQLFQDCLLRLAQGSFLLMNFTPDIIFVTDDHQLKVGCLEMRVKNTIQTTLQLFPSKLINKVRELLPPEVWKDNFSFDERSLQPVLSYQMGLFFFILLSTLCVGTFISSIFDVKPDGNSSLHKLPSV